MLTGPRPLAWTIPRCKACSIGNETVKASLGYTLTGRSDGTEFSSRLGGFASYETLRFAGLEANETVHGDLRLRASLTLDQDVTLQEARLREAGCDLVRSEKVSGASRVGRWELALLLGFVRPGDTLMVTRIDRLARSIRDLNPY